MLARLIDFIKMRRTTLLCTSLTAGSNYESQTAVGISSLMDTWLLVRNIEMNGERNRCLYILKSRGMAHSNQVREFVLSDSGIHLVDVYTGQGTVLTGSARLAQLEHERSDAEAARHTLKARQREIECKRAVAGAQIAALQAELAAQASELKELDVVANADSKSAIKARAVMAHSRSADDGSA